MGKKQILVVDDDPHIREVVCFALEKEGFKTLQANEGQQAISEFEKSEPGLMILDIMMPEMDGTEVCKRIRKISEVPIIFLSSRDDELDKILGLELGGDDYLTKPFSPRELVARVKAVLRRSPRTDKEKPKDEVLAYKDLSLDLNSFKVHYGQSEAALTLVEFGLLRTLMGRPGKVYSRDELMDRAYSENTVVSGRTIDSHIRRLRKKLTVLGKDPIQTVTGFGYKLELEE